LDSNAAYSTTYRKTDNNNNPTHHKKGQATAAESTQ
jgi:hypothetical protein